MRSIVLRSKVSQQAKVAMIARKSIDPMTAAEPAVNSVVRASEGYFLQLVKLMGELTGGGDILTGVLFVTIVFENTEIIRRMDGNSHAFAAVDDIPPDDMRQPVSIYSLAKSLGLPYETVRRYVNRMIDDGLCVKVGSKGGVIVPTSLLASPGMRAISTRHYAQSMKFFERVKVLVGA